MQSFAAFLKHVGTDLSLESYLIMPVQRVLRYKMLLEEIVKNTDAESEDYKDLNTALGMLSERAVQCNAAIKRRENTEALRRIQKSLGIEIVSNQRSYMYVCCVSSCIVGACVHILQGCWA